MTALRIPFAASALALAFTAAQLIAPAAQAGDQPLVEAKKTVIPPEEDKWQFLLAVPGWMAGIEGTVGVDGVNSNIDLGFDTILPKIDMIWATRAEASKGRFGILGELIYLGLSDGTGSNTLIQKVDIRIDETLADFTLRYRLIEGPRGYIDALAGVRYTNIYQALSLRPNDQRIDEVATEFTEEVSARLRERLEQTLTEGRFRNALGAAVSKRITNKIGAITGPEPKERKLPNAALAYRTPGRVGALLERLVLRQERLLVATAGAELREAEAAEEAAARQAIAAEKAKLRAKAKALRTRADQRVARAQKELENEVRKVLKKNLNQNLALTEDWWDPYVGLRARYNFTPAIYVIGRGDIGGFGVGSEFMWQAEGALGLQLTRSIYAELGYRALSFDYDQNGFLYDVIMHGAQVTVGIAF